MAKISVDILGRHLGTAMSSDEKVYQGFTVYSFQPAPGVNLPELCDLFIDCAHGWVVPSRVDGGGEYVYPTGGQTVHPNGAGPQGTSVIDLVDLLYPIPRK